MFNTCGGLSSCSDSTTDSTVPLNKFKCTCNPFSVYSADGSSSKIYDHGTTGIPACGKISL